MLFIDKKVAVSRTNDAQAMTTKSNLDHYISCNMQSRWNSTNDWLSMITALNYTPPPPTPSAAYLRRKNGYPLD